MLTPDCCMRRFAAAVDLAMKLEGHPQKAAILEALEQRRPGRVDAFFENFLTELAVTGREPRFCVGCAEGMLVRAPLGCL